MKKTFFSLFILVFIIVLAGAANDFNILNKKKPNNKTLVIGKDGSLQFVNKKGRKNIRSSVPRVPRTSEQTSNTTIVGMPKAPKKRKKASAKEYFETGKKFYAAKNYEDAKLYFSYALEKKKLASFYFWKGMSQRSLKEYDDMAKTFDLIIKSYDNSNVADDALFYNGLNAIKQDDYQKAVDCFVRLMEYYPNGSSEINEISFYNEVNKQVSLIRKQVTSRLLLLSYSGADLKEVIKRFQSKNGLKPTGEMDPVTIKKLKQLSDDAISKIELAKKEKEKGIPMLYFIVAWILLSIAIIWPVINLKSASEINDRILIFQDNSK